MPTLYDELLELLAALDGIPQSPRYHPEGDVLYHSLQVFEHARRDTADSALIAAALLHDVGKSLRSDAHDEDGADLLGGLVNTRIEWLVRHHLDLLRAPALTRRLLAGDPRLADLERLRAWDLAGRSPRATVGTPEAALRFVLRDVALVSADFDSPLGVIE